MGKMVNNINNTKGTFLCENKMSSHHHFFMVCLLWRNGKTNGLLEWRNFKSSSRPLIGVFQFIIKAINSTRKAIIKLWLHRGRRPKRLVISMVASKFSTEVGCLFGPFLILLNSQCEFKATICKREVTNMSHEIYKQNAINVELNVSYQR